MDNVNGKRRKNRVQGAWAKPQTQSLRNGQSEYSQGVLTVDSTAEHSQVVPGKSSVITTLHSPDSGEDSLKNQKANHQQSQTVFMFKDPRQNPMAGKQPYNFSWVIEGVLAGSGLPSQPAHLQFFKEQNIKHIVSLTEWKPSMHLCTDLKHTHMAVIEFESPQLKQAIDFVTLVDNAKESDEALVVHCHWGRGRTGTMLACYFIKEGLPPREAIQYIRQLRPYSVETYEQEDLVYEYAEYLHSKPS